MEQGRSTTSLRLSNKSNLIPRDISESLGKLPPQCLDLEEAVLGALMLEKQGLEDVIPFLKADHFYKEAHKEIYNAALALASEKAPVDMRTMVNKLRETGKIELIGGAYYIAELTSKVSSAANIVYHATVILEMSMKRQMIQIASDIHHNAYEDDADIHELIDRLDGQIEYLKKHNIAENATNKVKAQWDALLIKEEPPYVEPLFTLDGTSITPGNHSLFVGKKKSRKTLFIVWIISEYLKIKQENANKVLLFDTEQGKSHVWKLRKKIHQITGLWVPIFYLRGQSPTERRDFVRHTCAAWVSPPVWIVIDGIRDLMSNINDPDESTDLIVWLEKLTLQYNLHVSNILHLNKTDNNARGHIGSELLNKAEVTIEMELDEKNGCTTVKCESSREKPFETFSFTHDADGLPLIVGTPIKGSILPQEERKKRLEDVFVDGPMRYKEVIEEIMSHFSVGTNKSKSLLAEFMRFGWIIRNGKARDTTTMYKLIGTGPNGIAHLPVQTTMPLVTNPEPASSIKEDLPF